jgi:hypothetical protein
LFFSNFLAIPNQYLPDLLAIQQKNLCIRCDAFDRFWLVNIKIRCLNIPLWKIIDKQGMCVAKNTTEETMWSPDFNKAAIVEYTAAIPEAKAKPAVALPSYNFSTNSLVRCWSGYISIFLFGKWRTHVFGIFKYKLEVKYNGTECSNIKCVLIGYGYFSFKPNSSSFM